MAIKKKDKKEEPLTERKLYVKIFKVPVVMKAQHKHVEMEDHFLRKEEIELDENDLKDMPKKITKEAADIAQFNQRQLDMATIDQSITEVIMKVICKEDK